MPEEKKEPLQEAPEATEEEQAIDANAIADIIQGLLDQGLSAEQVLAIVEKAVQGGDLPEEAIEIAQQVLEQDEAKADELFGLQKQGE